MANGRLRELATRTELSYCDDGQGASWQVNFSKPQSAERADWHVQDAFGVSLCEVEVWDDGGRYLRARVTDRISGEVLAEIERGDATGLIGAVAAVVTGQESPIDWANAE